MSEDVWQASAASLEEDFGPHAPEEGAAAAAIQVGNLFQWGLKLLQVAIVPLLIGGFAMWIIGLVAGLLAQFANIGGSIAGSASSDPMIQEALGAASQLVVQLMAAPLLWIALAGILTAAAKAVTYGETDAGAVVPSATSLLALIVANLLLFAVQLPFLLIVAGTSAAGWAMGGNPEEQVLYMAGGMLVGFVLIFLPSVYIGLRLRLAVPAAIVEGSGLAGFKGSWEATRDLSTLLHLFLFGLVEGVVAIINVLLCCTFGLLTVITVPFFQGALTAAYIRATRPDAILDEAGFFES